MIAIVPARGGSKGLPGKNIKPLLDKPLIGYTIEAALAATGITDVYVSTDDEEIYRVGLECGASASFLRPPSLAQDNSLAVDSYIYTIDRLNEEFGVGIDEFIVLQPTSPLRKAVDIDAAISLFKEKQADSVVSYTEEHHPVSWHKYLDSDGSFENIFPDNTQNRQQNRPTYYPNGAIFVFRYDLIKQKRYYSEKSYAYVMERERSVDVDTIEDFDLAEYLMRKRG
jgi:CMP-N,N'-diacetyllegionaminic acid synthase